jgi:hypothetical protein
MLENVRQLLTDMGATGVEVAPVWCPTAQRYLTAMVGRMPTDTYPNSGNMVSGLLASGHECLWHVESGVHSLIVYVR